MSEDVIVITGNKSKAIWLFLGSTAFVVGGVAMIKGGDSAGWFVAGFFGLCLATSIYMLTPNAIRLQIDRNGIEMKSLFKPVKIVWADVDGFYVGKIRTGHSSTKLIGISYSASYSKLTAGRKAAAALTGMEGALPNHFSLPAEELCKVLNDAKQRWG